MITWDIENIICATVEALLPTSSDPKKGLMIRLEFRIISHDKDGDVYYSSRLLELVFQRPSNYTKVFSRVLNHHGEVLKDWKNMSNHDSCWRSDGLRDIFDLYMDVRHDMESLNPEYNFKDTETSITAPTFGEYIKFVEVEIEKDEFDSYKYILKSVK